MPAEEVNESLTAERYRVFAQVDAGGLSPEYARLASAIADDEAMLARIDRLPKAKRQAGFFLAVARYLGVPVGDYALFREQMFARWESVERVAWQRTMQTNDPARAAAMLPALAAIPGPIALIDVGASAGLVLNLDRYSYSYGKAVRIDPASGPSEVRLSVTTRGRSPRIERMPDIVWRAGIDLNPLDVGDPGDLAWLRALIWPHDEVRLANFDAAVGILREHPVRIVQGDLRDRLDEVVASAPRDAKLVVMHSALLSYVAQEASEWFVQRVAEHGGVLVGHELPDVIPGVEEPGEADEAFSFLVTVDGRLVAHAHPHAAWLRWLG